MSPPSDVPNRFPWQTAIFGLVLVIYTVFAFAVDSDQLIWDEGRYVTCAEYITEGYLVEDDHPDFVNGPGYPLVLAPFVAWEIPLLWARILNGVFVALAAVLLYYVIRRHAANTWAVVAALAMALHPNLLRVGPYLMTEALTVLCVCLFLFCFDLVLRGKGGGWLWVAAAAAVLAYLIMVRVFFGHVATVMLLLSLALLVCFKVWRPVLVRSALVMALALALCLPYLTYTYKKTGEFPCWSTNSGELLYWLTSSNPGENGHWFSYEDAQNMPELAPNHKEFFRHALSLGVAEREAAFKHKAMENLRAAPARVAVNWASNVCRLFFGFPRSFLPEELVTLLIIGFNFPLLVLFTLAILLAAWNWRSLTPLTVLVCAFALFYIGGSTLAPSLPRYFVILTPVLWLAIVLILPGKVHLRFLQSSSKS